MFMLYSFFKWRLHPDTVGLLIHQLSILNQKICNETSEKFYSCVLNETLIILQQAKDFLTFIAIKKKIFLNNFRESITYNKKQKTAVLNRGQANVRGPGGFEAKDFTFKAKAKNFKHCPRGLHPVA